MTIREEILLLNQRIKEIKEIRKELQKELNG